MTIPKIFERKITVRRLPGGYKQYIMTLPKEYAEALKEKGINSLIVVFNYGLGCFPKTDKDTENAVMMFLKEHPEFEKMFVVQKESSVVGTSEH